MLNGLKSQRQSTGRDRMLKKYNLFAGKRTDRNTNRKSEAFVSVKMPEYRLSLNKDSTLTSSNFLKSIVNQTLNADIALSPYTITMQ